MSLRRKTGDEVVHESLEAVLTKQVEELKQQVLKMREDGLRDE